MMPTPPRVCILCDEPIADGDPTFDTVSGDEGHERCRESHEQNEAERAYESFCSDYYGGDGPCTVQEHYEAAWKQRREMER
jgi:hypothetical protein